MLIFIAEMHASYYDEVYLYDYKINVNEFDLENDMGCTTVTWSTPTEFTFNSFIEHIGFSDVSYNILAPYSVKIYGKSLKICRQRGWLNSHTHTEQFLQQSDTTYDLTVTKTEKDRKVPNNDYK